ncbi:hypothetical protein CJ030_MR0G007156 [Morella rubra]|uniref:Uncharacterized protein n=1 Tax=Morella rubra TaxID=262757 RepID=A0A6A1UJY0_9ROSI|nr:hypothetical protein CJ030_MR0G007156 [Morella rubra]
MEALSESERTREEVDHQQQQQTNKITFGCSIDSLLKEIDLPNMHFQISGAMDGDISIFIWRHPRIVRRRVNFSSNIKLLVGSASSLQGSLMFPFTMSP